MKRLILIVTLAVFILSAIIYTGLWFWMAEHVRTQAESILAKAQEKEIVILTRRLEVRGFPFSHVVHFSGSISHADVTAEIPELRVKSLFLPGRPVEITAEQGFKVTRPEDAAIWSLDYLYIKGEIPKFIPESLTHEDLAAWKQAGGSLAIERLEARKQSLNVTGSGNLFLDDMLQPAGALQTRITGHFDFLIWLAENKYIETRETMLATAILSGLTRTDGGESYMEVALTLQNRTLFVGPLQLVRLPLIVWGWRSPPDRLQ